MLCHCLWCLLLWWLGAIFIVNRVNDTKIQRKEHKQKHNTFIVKNLYILYCKFRHNQGSKKFKLSCHVNICINQAFPHKVRVSFYGHGPFSIVHPEWTHIHSGRRRNLKYVRATCFHSNCNKRLYAKPRWHCSKLCSSQPDKIFCSCSSPTNNYCLNNT